ncbi:MAG: hypothetical protein IT341_08635 [Chloroflexi bacterium]|nr:hypothetical protein [Chloroflexota bacterium]
MTAPEAARRLAARIERHRLTTPARLLVDAHRPLGPLIADVGAAIGPWLSMGAGPPGDDLRAVVDEPDGLDRLVEAMDAARDGTPDAIPG